MRPLGNVNHAGRCCSCALLRLAGRRSGEGGPVEGSQAGDLQTEQVRSHGPVGDKHCRVRFYIPTGCGNVWSAPAEDLYPPEGLNFVL